MTKPPLKNSSALMPLVDKKQLRAELDKIFEDAGKDAKPQIIAQLKKALVDGRSEAEQRLLQNRHGFQCARQLSALIDGLIEVLYSFVSERIYPVQNLSLGERIALVAVGGYGRGTLAPGSDIDLLFLLPWRQTPWGEQVMEYILYMLWDVGLKVGHATRNINDTIRIAKDDISVRTSLLETRFLAGNKTLYDDLQSRFEKDVVKGSAPEFIRAKLLERDERHHKIGKSRYLVEPNIKEGKGGQRDLQTLLWISKYFFSIKTNDDLVKLGILSKPELAVLNKANNFLWAVRCHMHFLTGKAEERLSFDIQRDIAQRLGYTAHPGMEDVERFMKHYFLVAKEVGDLTRIICAALEEKHAKPVPGLDRIFLSFSRRKQRIAGARDFIIDNKRINITHADAFQRDPLNLIRMFDLGDKLGLEFHPFAIQGISRSLKLIDSTLRENEEANRLFLGILTSKRDPALILRRMNESGVLGKFIPDFGKIVAMMQFNRYHHYTVDEHLLRSVACLSALEHGESSKDHPLAAQIMPTITSERRILYVATFLHDVAKGRPEDHSSAGAKIARKLGPRLGLNPHETETVSWLIRQHLTMSIVAQSRDLGDHKTIADFANIVQTMDRLKLLLILTICDIKAVGPGVWNGWKGQLLRTLYFETELVLRGGFSSLSSTERITGTQQALLSRLNQWNDKEKQDYLQLHYPHYWLTMSLDDQLRHANFIYESDHKKSKTAILVQPLELQAVTEITVLTQDHPRLLAIITGACAAANVEIVDARIFTTSDGRAFDIININREFTLNEDEFRRATKVGKMIEDALNGAIEIPKIVASRAKPRGQNKAFRVFPHVVIDNLLSNKFTVIEVTGIDRAGLLYHLTRTLADLALNIASAHITTFGEKIIDSFYVTNLQGGQILSKQKQLEIQAKLITVLEDNGFNQLSHQPNLKTRTGKQ